MAISLKAFAYISLLKPSNPLRFIPRQYAKVSNCNTPVCDIRVVKAPVGSEEKCKVRDFLTKYHFSNDPLLKAANLHDLPPDPVVLQYFLQMLDEGKTLYSVVNGSTEILGLAICHTISPATAKELHSFASKIRREDCKRYFEFLAMLEERTNLYKTFSVNRILQVDIVCTKTMYRRRGICKQLLKECKEMAKAEKSYGLFRMNTGNIYAGRAAAKLPQTQAVLKKSVDAFKDPQGAPWLKKDLCLPHRQIEVYISDLRKGGSGSRGGK